MSDYDDFIERLEAALLDEVGREDFLDYVQGLSKEGRAEILAEADRLETEASSD